MSAKSPLDAQNLALKVEDLEKKPQILPKKQICFFVSFLGESAALQFCFEIYWPLE